MIHAAPLLTCGGLLAAGGALSAAGAHWIGRRRINAAMALILLSLAAALLIVVPSGEAPTGGWEIDDLLSRTIAAGGIALSAFWIVVGVSGSIPADDRGGGFGLVVCAAGGVVLTASSAGLPGICIGLAVVWLAMHAPLWEAADPEMLRRRQQGLLYPACALSLLMIGAMLTSVIAGTARLALVGSAQPIPGWGSAIASPWMVLAATLIAGSLAGLVIVVPETLRHPRHADRIETWMAGVWLTLPRLAALTAFLRIMPHTLAVGLPHVVPLMIVLTAGGLLLTAAWAARTVELRALLMAIATSASATWLVGVCVACWEVAPGGRLPSPASGLMPGASVALFAAACDLIAIASLFTAVRYLVRSDRAAAFTDDLAGAIAAEPWAAAVIAGSLLSLCGAPPTPGFWSRWWLLTAAFRPRHASSLTGLYDLHWGFLLLAAALVIQAAVMVMLVARLLEVLLLCDPVSHTPASGGRMALVASVAMSVCLTVIVVKPLATAKAIDRAAGSRVIAPRIPEEPPSREGLRSNGVSSQAFDRASPVAGKRPDSVRGTPLPMPIRKVEPVVPYASLLTRGLLRMAAVLRLCSC